MQINVSLQNREYKYSLGDHLPQHTVFVHHCLLSDQQITWLNSAAGQRVTITFGPGICPLVNADGTPWARNTATFPGKAAKVNPDFPRDRYYSLVKYTVTLPDDTSGTPPHDPEVIIVDG